MQALEECPDRTRTHRRATVQTARAQTTGGCQWAWIDDGFSRAWRRAFIAGQAPVADCKAFAPTTLGWALGLNAEESEGQRTGRHKIASVQPGRVAAARKQQQQLGAFYQKFQKPRHCARHCARRRQLAGRWQPSTRSARRRVTGRRAQ